MVALEIGTRVVSTVRSRRRIQGVVTEVWADRYNPRFVVRWDDGVLQDEAPCNIIPAVRP